VFIRVSFVNKTLVLLVVWVYSRDIRYSESTTEVTFGFGLVSACDNVFFKFACSTAGGAMPKYRLADCVRQQPSKDPRHGSCFWCGKKGHFHYDKFTRKRCRNPPLVQPLAEERPARQEAHALLAQIPFVPQQSQQVQQQSAVRARSFSAAAAGPSASANQRATESESGREREKESKAKSKESEGLRSELEATKQQIQALHDKTEQQKKEIEQQKREIERLKKEQEKQNEEEKKCREKAEHLHKLLHIVTRRLVCQELLGYSELESVEKEEKRLWGDFEHYRGMHQPLNAGRMFGPTGEEFDWDNDLNGEYALDLYPVLREFHRETGEERFNRERRDREACLKEEKETEAKAAEKRALIEAQAKETMQRLKAERAKAEAEKATAENKSPKPAPKAAESAVVVTEVPAGEKKKQNSKSGTDSKEEKESEKEKSLNTAEAEKETEKPTEHTAAESADPVVIVHATSCAATKQQKLCPLQADVNESAVSETKEKQSSVTAAESDKESDKENGKENGKAQQSSTRQSAAGKKKAKKATKAKAVSDMSLSKVTAPAVNTRSKSRVLQEALA